MKIIGLLLTWNSDKFIAASIEQSLSICDELIMSIGPHNPIMNKYVDDTLKIAQEYQQKYPDKITLVPVQMGGAICQTKGNTMNAMLGTSKHREAGNWIWLMDVDEYYHDNDLKLMRETAENGKYDMINTNEKYFYINMKKYMQNTSKCPKQRLWKIDNPGSRFLISNQWTGKRPKEVLLDVDMYHYSILMNPYAKIDFWNAEYPHKQNHKSNWIRDVYLKYDLENEESLGVDHPFKIGEICFQTNGGKLMDFTNKHPRIIEESGLTEIKDFRLLYNPIK